MSQQYLRTLSLIVADSAGNGLDLSNLRVRFSVKRGDTQTPNSCEARIYNMAKSTTSAIQNEFTQVVLQAGYGGNVSLLFRGVITQTRRGRIDQRDSYLDITSTDGDEAYNYAPMALTLAAGAPPANDLQVFLAAMAKPNLGKIPAITVPVTQGFTSPLPTNGRVRARTYFGQARDCLRAFCRSYDLKWSIQDGKLVVIQNGYYIPGEPVVISPSNGLIGVPEQTERGLSLRILLNPSVKIGQLIKLDSSNINQYRYGLGVNAQASNLTLAQQSTKLSSDGLYYVMRADHYGDTRDNEWYSDLTCLATDAAVPNTSVPGAAIGPTPVARY